MSPKLEGTVHDRLTDLEEFCGSGGRPTERVIEEFEVETFLRDDFLTVEAMLGEMLGKYKGENRRGRYVRVWKAEGFEIVLDPGLHNKHGRLLIKKIDMDKPVNMSLI